MTVALHSVLDLVLFAETVLLITAFAVLWPWRHHFPLKHHWLCPHCDRLHTRADHCPPFVRASRR